MATEYKRPTGILNRLYELVGAGLTLTVGLTVVLTLAALLFIAFSQSRPPGPTTVTSERKAPVPDR